MEHLDLCVNAHDFNDLGDYDRARSGDAHNQSASHDYDDCAHGDDRDGRDDGDDGCDHLRCCANHDGGDGGDDRASGHGHDDGRANFLEDLM